MFTATDDARIALLAMLAETLIAIQADHPLRVGIDGRSAAGKTTLADELALTLTARGRAVLRASIDDFHLPGHALRSKTGGWTPQSYYDEGYDYHAFVALVLRPLGPGGNRRCRPALFDSFRDQWLPEEWRNVAPDAIAVIDGVFLQRPALAEHWDYLIWLDVDTEMIIERARQRDLAWLGAGAADEVERRYRERVLPTHALYERLTGASERAHALIDQPRPSAPGDHEAHSSVSESQPSTAIQPVIGHRPLLFVVGPTASGKTALALALAERFNGEIINADSRQFYRGMDIGTAKPTEQERARAVHHLIDLLNPDQVCGLAWFLDAARVAIAEIRARGRLPIICGGTGQYIRALLENWDVPRVPPDAALRARLTARAEAEGGERLLAELAALDPARAAQLDARNVRRVVRALEVALLRSRDAAVQSDRTPAPVERPLTLGIRLERAALYERIDARVEAIYAAGLVAEVQALNAAGFDCAAPAMNAIGYREVCEHLSGALTLDEARARTKFATHRLARTQHAWFRPLDPRIVWLDAERALIEQAAAITARYLARFDEPGDDPLALVSAG